MPAQSHQLGTGLTWEAVTEVFIERCLATSPKHLCSRHSGFCFAKPVCHQLFLSLSPWLHFQYPKLPFWTLTSRTFRGRTPGTTAFIKKKICLSHEKIMVHCYINRRAAWGFSLEAPVGRHHCSSYSSTSHSDKGYSIRSAVASPSW